MTAVLTSAKNNNGIHTKANPDGLMFNSEVKEQFLKEMTEHGVISENTAKTYRNLFRRTYTFIEKKKKKDLYQLTFKEMEKLLQLFEANNRSTIESYARVISSYLNWATEKGFTEKNVIGDLKPDDFEKYLEKSETYLTEDRLLDIEENCKNAQDAVILRMLFNGFSGKNLSEIRNLKKQDIDKNKKMIRLVNTLKEDPSTGLPVDFTYRWEPVDDYTLELIEDAIQETTYMKKNGEIAQGPSGRAREYTELVDNDYVVRPSITKTDTHNKPVDRHVVYRRVKTLAEYFNMKDTLDTRLIMRSGMIFCANNMIENDELSLNALKMVASRFNMRTHHNLKGFLTVENIRKTYPKED